MFSPDVLLTALWIYARIQSPFLVFCSYGLIKRFEWIASPFVVTPAVVGVCGLFYFHAIPNADFPLLYFHLPMAAVFILVAYSVLFWKLDYPKADALVLSLLTFMAMDELWQTATNLQLWSQSLHNLEVGLTTAAWNYMSIPFLGYFLLKFNGKVRVEPKGAFLFGLAATTTLASVFFPYDLTYDYLLVFPWFVFFLFLFQACRYHSVEIVPKPFLDG